MRTTLTLEPDVAKALERIQVERHASFKAVVNELLRAGVAAVTCSPKGVACRYRTKPVSLGKPRLPNIDNIAEVLTIAEGEGHL